jgi:cation diffusion facilitator CzcD-associated flavoprotein CzcO
MSRTLRVAVIGAGMAGILSAVRLMEAGIEDFTVYEKADRLGGTWRENTYPGIACDVPSHLYSYSFALNSEWSHPYSPGAEILTYLERVAQDHDVAERIRYGAEMTSCEFMGGKWHLETASGLHDAVDVVIAATGVLHHPRYPDIGGLESFNGALFHSSRWDHCVGLEAKRVGVVGTGSTAVQIVTAVAEQVRSLSLFQRTAQWIMPQENPPYDEETKGVFRSNPGKMREMHETLSSLFAEGFANAVVDAGSPQMKMIAEMCRTNLELNVVDPVLREKLRPDYQAACKRLVVSGNFYDVIQRTNVELVTERIERVEPVGVRTTDERVHELDVLVLATGFKVDAFMRPMSVVGRNNARLSDKWAERPNAYLSISMPDFPNFFMVNGPNGPVGNFSLIEVAELQLDYIMQLVDLVRSGQCDGVSATRAAMDQYEAARVEAAKKTIWMTGCRSWYLDDRGIPATWPWTFDRFREEMRTPKTDAFEFV